MGIRIVSSLEYPHSLRVGVLSRGLIALLQVALVSVLIILIPFQSPNIHPVWGSKPVLGYFALTPSIAGRLQLEAGLSATKMQVIEQVARQEENQLWSLEEESQVIIKNPQLTLEQKKAEIARMGYNRRVHEAIQASEQRLENELGVVDYAILVNWIERRWIIERKLHGSYLKAPGARTYEIYATRYDSKGAYYVALPDQCVKFTNGGNRLCEKDGYVVGQKYDVYVSYKKGVGVRVGESGPWNVDDNYWATLSDPTPRRMFADLPLGMPEAQAAYFNGYNGGKDQYGRIVTAPFGIDLARQVSIDIGLQPGVNDWINVSFLWTDGWGGGSAASGSGAQGPTPITMVPAKAATPNPDGSIVHEVQPGQTLWEIATVYQVSLQDLLTLNNLSDASVVFAGQKLIIKAADSTPTPIQDMISETATSVEDVTKTVKLPPSPWPTRTPIHRTTTSVVYTIPMPTTTWTVKIPEGTLRDLGAGLDADTLFITIAVIVGLGISLIFLGALLRRRT